MSRFKFSQRSLDRMKGVHPDLVRVARRALELTTVDFGVVEGRRAAARQAELVKTGASQTLDSRHLTGHAIDVAAYIGARVSWDFALYYQIANAFRAASIELGAPVRWGGSWTVLKAGVTAERAVQEYAARCKAAGRKPFFDAGHFELPAAAASDRRIA